MEKIKVISEYPKSELEKFNNAEVKLYPKLQIKKKIENDEAWYIIAGSATLNTSDGQVYKTKANDIVKLTHGLDISPLVVSEDLILKKILTDPRDIALQKENVKINYLIIRTIYKALGCYDPLIEEIEYSGFEDVDYLFETAVKEGNPYAACIDNYLVIKECISSLHKVTNISKQIWRGEVRLLTGMKCRSKKIKTNYSIDDYGVLSCTLKNNEPIEINMLSYNPLGLDEETSLQKGMADFYTLENLIKLKIKDILESANIQSIHVEIDDMEDVWDNFLTDKCLPKYFQYSDRIETVIKTAINVAVKLYE